MLVEAHIGGMPVEETALNFAPLLTTAGGITWMRLRRVLACRKQRAVKRREVPP